ncbi:MAG: CdaR family protein [Blautia sp.]|nr:CdaR family protein [Blautia sp.]MCM1202325.1 CdaR family protein [Bacteroides fragilis]
MKNKLLRNWGLKLCSFLIAAILWLIVTNINDPVGTFRVYNVPVDIQNADLITNSGQVYEILDHTDVIDVVTIQAKRSIIDSLNESNIIAVADMNELTNLNTIAIRLSTNKYNDKLESIRGNIDNVKLNIEDEKTKTLPLRTVTIGTVKEGYMVGDISTEQNLIEISGPESVVSQVKRATVTVNVSGFTNNIGTDSPIRLYDENDQIIDVDSIVKNINKVRVTVEILELKTVDINWKFTGTPGRGYIATGEINAGRNSVTIAGRSKTIANVNAIEIPESVLDITGAVESLQTLVDITDYLPEGVILAEENFRGKVNVTVVVEPVVERAASIATNRIQILNVPEGFEVEIDTEDDAHDFTLVGLESDLNELDLSTIQASVDITALMEAEGMTSMSAGHYTAGLIYSLDNSAVTVRDTSGVRLIITEAE